MPDIPKFIGALPKILLALTLIPVMAFAQDDMLPTASAVAEISRSVSAQSSEMVILVDNSNAMQTLDVDGRLITALTGFIDRNDRLVDTSIMAFADDVTLIRSLGGDGPVDPVALAETFAVIDYQGLTSDIIRARERAVYELEYNGRTGIPKAIVIISASVDDVTTANAVEPAALVIPPGLSDGDIELFIIQIGDDNSAVAKLPPESITAGFSLNDLNGLEGVLMQLVERTTGAADALVSNELPTSTPTPSAVVNQTPPATNNIPAVASTALVEEDRTRSIIIIVTAFLLILALSTLIVLLFLRSRKSAKGPDIAVTEACLRDIHGYTSSESFRLGEKATMLGRVAGKDSANIDYIVIPEATIGRRHAVIEYKDYGYWITDQGSINGTFVNDAPISSEVRLKHGDIVRLHKYEFRFVVPELDEAPATRVSETVMAGHTSTAEIDKELDELKGRTGSAGFELDLDFSGDDAPMAETDPVPASYDETLLPGHDMESRAEDEETGSEVTLMPDMDQLAPGSVENATPTADKGQNGETAEDETLMPAQLDESGDDETIRPNRESSDDEIFDITGGDEEKP